MADARTDPPGRPASRVTLVLICLLAGLAFSGFTALGTWQVHRMGWKQDLIARVEQRVHAPAIPAPPAHASVGTADEYRHVQLNGVFLHEHEALVQASTVLGSGFWVLTPLRRPDGSVVFVNRGFVPPEGRDAAQRLALSPRGPISLTGLLRLPEPRGGFLRHNDPAADRWYSRDVAGLATVRGLRQVAPYFVDASASKAPASSPAVPVGGLTVISFPDHHLVYALTWYALALMVAGAAGYVLRQERQLRRHER